MSKIFLLCVTIFLCGINNLLQGQITYFNTQNQIYKMEGGIGSCNNVPISNECGPDIALLSMALFKDTLYYNTFNGQLKRFKLGVPGSCEVLMQNGALFNSMTVDKKGMIYMASRQLYRYDPYTGSIDNLGDMPFGSGGDLIFFRDKLLLAGNNFSTNSTGIFEINIADPANSMVYMNTSAFIGLVSYPVACTNSRYFGLVSGGNTTDLVELDLMNKKQLNSSCIIPMSVLDAASTTETGVDDDVYITNLKITAPCQPNASGTLHVVATYGATGAITYILNGTTTNTTGHFPNLPPGNHSVRVIAPNGLCIKDSAFSMIPGKNLIKGADVVHPDRCELNTGSITIHSQPVNLPITYTLRNTGASQPDGVFSNLGPGIYNFNIKDAAGCEKDTSITLAVTNAPFIKAITLIPARCETDNGEIKITLGVNSTNATTSINNGPFTSTFHYADLKPGNYYIQVKKGTDCFFDATVIIEAKPFQPECSDIYVPNAFTPNNDGKNDVLRPWDLSFTTAVTFRIYNRWGQLIYEGKGAGVGWDGTLNGIKQMSGVYTYTLLYTNFARVKKLKKGTIVLIR